MNRMKKSIIVFILILATLTLGVSADTEYSSADDPLVSKSYVNDVLGPQIMAQVLEKIEKEYVKLSDISNVSAGEYKVLTLSKNQTLMASGVCEIVILSGNATALITSSANVSNGEGLIDLTVGSVITNGSLIKTNSYVIIPKSDGRGFVVTSDSAVILVRGTYVLSD